MTSRTPSRLILASGSRFKQQELARLALRFEAMDADIDEIALPGEAPDTLATRLAVAKARAIATLHPEAYVIGADQVVSLNGEQLHKPRTRERAIAQLTELQGKTHDIHCAVALVTPTQSLTRLVHARMTMRALTRAQIERYVREDDVLFSAGSYTIEAGGIRLFHAMECDDYSAIIGLPLTRVLDLLDEAGAPDFSL